MRNRRQTWQAESGWNTQFGTNCGRLPDAFRADKQSGVCRCTALRYLCIGKSAGNVMMARIDRENPHACAQEFQKETVVMKKSRQLDETQLSGRKE
ncbi:hypothetical protein [Bacteroides pyogenes]|uniref:hypothetical protein n=1 Tax=Bacteroides pyogenes TaxID=310300 RepID=UPI002FD99A65